MSKFLGIFGGIVGAILVVGIIAWIFLYITAKQKTSLYLAAVAFLMGVASFLFAQSAFLGDAFVPAWMALASIITGVAAVITGASAIGKFSMVTTNADTRAQQIADASLKQITARTTDAD